MERKVKIAFVGAQGPSLAREAGGPGAQSLGFGFAALVQRLAGRVRDR